MGLCACFLKPTSLSRCKS
uniref:Uncharacterized protein n=1 Tax=Anguilla anguilla TaxID=7936 RepID=A0A0E9T2C5_ANGAN